MNTLYISQVIEACLLTSGDYLNIQQISLLFDNSIADETLVKIIQDIANSYQDSGIELLQGANGYRFRSRPEYQMYLNKLFQIKPLRYSRATMETLAIIAYRQPITRGEIEEIRGVTINSNIIQSLFDRGWIEVVGHKQLPGKPELLATTNKFLEDLTINSLAELPPLNNIENFSMNLNNDIIEEYDIQKELNNG